MAQRIAAVPRDVAGLARSIAAAMGVALQGCAAHTPATDPGLVVVTADPPSSAERYCAWYGARDGDVLYFGQAAFWSAMRDANGDPTADMLRAGPQLVGRFDLAREALLPPLPVGDAESRSGVWDVWVGGDAQVYFTTFFEQVGSVDPSSGRVRRLVMTRPGSNELADGPGATLLVSLYGSTVGLSDGGVIAIGPDGLTAAHWPLEAPAGYRVAAKTPAWDPLRGELWVTTDLLPLASVPGVPLRHDAYVLDLATGTQRRIERPEVQFAARAPDGTLYAAEVEGSDLQLRVTPPPGGPPAYRVPLDAAFASELDFVQDIQPAADGRVAVTRWSGHVHVLHPDGTVRSAELPRLDPQGLYYTGVLHGERLCATYCADVTVVCVDAP